MPSQHTALSWGHALELEQHLKEEVARLMALAEAADTTEVPDGMDIPAELARRTSGSRRLVKPRPSWKREPRSGTLPSKPRTKPSKPNAQPKPRRLADRRGPSRNRPNRAYETATRSISPTTSRASCQPQARVSYKPTTCKREWRAKAC